jgi:hypothetical protein
MTIVENLSERTCRISGRFSHELQWRESPAAFSRRCYISGSVIVKIGGNRQCQREVSLLPHIAPADRKYFPQVIAYRVDCPRGEQWIAEEYVDMLTEDEWYALEDCKRAEVQKLVAGLLYRYDLTWDARSDTYRNWGVRRDTLQPIVYDFCPSHDWPLRRPTRTC